MVENIAVCSRSFSKNQILKNELLNKYNNVKFNDKGVNLVGDELVDFLKDSHKVIVALEKIDENILSNLPNLKVISKYGVGLDSIDLNALKKYKIKLGWVGGVNKRSVSELTLALTLNILRNINNSVNQIKDGIFNQNIGKQLTSKNFGIIGCGNIGKDLIKILKPFNCNIFIFDKIDLTDFCKKENISQTTLKDLIKQSDIISVHLPLDTITKNFINKEMLSLMKSDSVLINTARGGIVDEVALKEHLINNFDFRAAFDVYATEPPTDLDLLRLPNFIGTPHIGGSSIEAILAMGRSAINGLEENHYVS